VSAIGTSWNTLRQNERNSKVTILPGLGVGEADVDQQRAFTQADLELQWLSMCNRMPEQLVGIATRMKNMTPVITELPAIEVVVGNALVKDEMERILGSIVNTLKLHLRNNAITLTIRVAEREEQEKVLTRREQFEQMMSRNPAIGKLLEVFDLELA
jgi:DNA polymerase-3 subunit gamma/tau